MKCNKKDQKRIPHHPVAIWQFIKLCDVRTAPQPRAGENAVCASAFEFSVLKSNPYYVYHRAADYWEPLIRRFWLNLVAGSQKNVSLFYFSSSACLHKPGAHPDKSLSNRIFQWVQMHSAHTHTDGERRIEERNITVVVVVRRLHCRRQYYYYIFQHIHLGLVASVRQSRHNGYLFMNVRFM